jgi:hypothetical protein
MKSDNLDLYLMVAIGCGFLIGCVFSLSAAINLVINGQTVDGLISKQVAHSCSSGKDSNNYPSTCYQAFVTYKLSGIDYEAGMPERSSSDYVMGSEVVLLVDPRSPAKPEFKGAGIWAVSIITFVLGFGFAAAGIFFLRE